MRGTTGHPVSRRMDPLVGLLLIVGLVFLGALVANREWELALLVGVPASLGIAIGFFTSWWRGRAHFNVKLLIGLILLSVAVPFLGLVWAFFFFPVLLGALLGLGIGSFARSRVAAREALARMSPRARRLLEAALAMPPEARVALAESLIEGLDDAMDDEALAAWRAEVAKRIRELEIDSTHPWQKADRATRDRPGQRS